MQRLKDSSSSQTSKELVGRPTASLVRRLSVSAPTSNSSSATDTTIVRRRSSIRSIGGTTPLKGALAGTGSSSREALMGLAAGALFGMVSPVVGHPFDLVKTKMQTTYHHSSLTHCVQDIYRTEGVRGFYRGFVPPLIGSIAFRSVLFSTYSGTYSYCARNYPSLQQPIPYTGGLQPCVLIGAMAAASARSLIETPLEFIKVRVMVNKSALQDVSHASTSRTGVATTTSLLQSPISSLRHMYHGFIPTALRTMGLLGSFFVLVDYSVRYIPDVVNAPMIGPFFKGGVCATAAWALCFPLESAKSVIQADATGKYKQMPFATWKVMKELYTERGIRKGLYRGFAPGAGRSFVANGISMLVYSSFQDFFRQEE